MIHKEETAKEKSLKNVSWEGKHITQKASLYPGPKAPTFLQISGTARNLKKHQRSPWEQQAEIQKLSLLSLIKE